MISLFDVYIIHHVTTIEDDDHPVPRLLEALPHPFISWKEDNHELKHFLLEKEEDVSLLKGEKEYDFMCSGCAKMKEALEELRIVKKENMKLKMYISMLEDECGHLTTPSVTHTSMKGNDDVIEVDGGAMEGKREREGRRGRRMVATVNSDKVVMQGIAPSIGSKAGTPAWTSTGDPCNDAWRGITCDDSGYITQIALIKSTLLGDDTALSLLEKNCE